MTGAPIKITTPDGDLYAAVRDAVRQLSPDVDHNWNADGTPCVDKVNALVDHPENVDAAYIEMAMPGFTQAKADALRPRFKSHYDGRTGIVTVSGSVSYDMRDYDRRPPSVVRRLKRELLTRRDELIHGLGGLEAQALGAYRTPAKLAE